MNSKWKEKLYRPIPIPKEIEYLIKIIFLIGVPILLFWTVKYLWSRGPYTPGDEVYQIFF